MSYADAISTSKTPFEMKSIFLIRHGITDSNKNRVYAGWSDEHLLNEGISDIELVGTRLESFKIEKIFSSPIQRAKETAKLLSLYLNVNFEIADEFVEMRMGPWEGLSQKEVGIQFPSEWILWNTFPSQLRLPGRETLEELCTRALQGIMKLVLDNRFSRTLVVTHVAIIRVLFIHFNNLDMNSYRMINVPNVSVFKIEFSDNMGRITKLTS